MNRFVEWVYKTMGRIVIPKHLMNTQTSRVLHVSDTPSAIYKELERLIREIRPDIIIHTGDLVDDVKLEIYPGRINDYRKALARLSKCLAQSEARCIIAIGNHDDKASVVEMMSFSEIIDEVAIIDLYGTRFAIGHKPLVTTVVDADVYCYGHSLELPVSPIRSGAVYANGIWNIHLFEPENGAHYTLDYPIDTNDYRLCKRRVGL